MEIRPISVVFTPNEVRFFSNCLRYVPRHRMDSFQDKFESTRKSWFKDLAQKHIEAGHNEEVANLLAYSGLDETLANTPAVSFELSIHELIKLRALADSEVIFLQDQASNIDAYDAEAQVLTQLYFPEDVEETYLGDKDLDSLKAMEFEDALRNIAIGTQAIRQIELYLGQ